MARGVEGWLRDRATNLGAKSFEKFIEDNKDEITALQILYSRPYKQRITHEQLKELARAIERPKQPGIAPIMPERVWQAYEVLDKSKVRGSATKLMTDLVSLVRYAVTPGGRAYAFQGCSVRSF